MNLTPDKWTIIATSDTPGRWKFQPGHTSTDAMDRAKCGEWIVMHRKADGGWQLLARLSSPAWRKLDRWCERNPWRRRA